MNFELFMLKGPFSIVKKHFDVEIRYKIVLFKKYIF